MKQKSIEKPLEPSVEEVAVIPVVIENPESVSPRNTTTRDEDDQVVSRLLGRLSSPVDNVPSHMQIPMEKNMFMSTNDLSLSPPKENRLAAMIAVLGGTSTYLAVIRNRYSLVNIETPSNTFFL